MTIKDFEKWAKASGLQNKLNRDLYDIEYIDPNTQRTFIGFEAGWKARQLEVDNLSNINFESDLHLTAAKEEITRLKDGMKRLLKSYNAQKSLPMSDEFNRGWVSAFSCVVEDLERLIK